MDGLIAFSINVVASVFNGSAALFASRYAKGSNIEKVRSHMESDLEKEFRAYFKTSQAPEALIINENFDIFVSFLKSPQVRDFFGAYANYMLKGSHYDELKRELKLPNGALSIPNEKVVRYLTKNFMNTYSSEYSEITNFDWHTVWEYLIEAINSVMLSKLTKHEAYHLAINNTRMDKSLEYLAEMLKNDNERMYEKINHLIKQCIIKSDKNYDEIKNRYRKILKDNFNTAHIYLLGEYAFDKFYVAPELKMFPSRQTRSDVLTFVQNDLFWDVRMNWNDIFRNDNIVYVIGGAGYGKSLFLRNLIINHNKLIISDADEFLPIFCDMKNYLTETVKHRPMTEYLQESMISATALEKDDISMEFINYHLSRGRCLILLDALDEVPKESRYEMHKTVISYMKNINPHNRVCITSRTRGFVPVSDAIVFDIPSLEKKQVEQYVDNIILLGDFKESEKDDFLEQAKNLIEKRFLNSFLVLSLLVNIYRAERELPENKLDLYAKCFEYIANKREKEKNAPKKQYNWDRINPFMKDNTFIRLATLCFPNNHEVDRKDVFDCLLSEYGTTSFSDAVACENAITEFLDFCAERTELFVPAQKDDSFKFFHRSFFEYFYSLQISLEIQDVSSIYEQFSKFDVDSEIFELTMSSFKQRRHAKYIETINFLFDAAHNELKANSFTAYNILTILVTQIITEPIYHEKYVDVLVSFMDSIVGSINKHDGVKNTDMILTFCEANKDFPSRIVNGYNKYINRDMMMLISIISPIFLEKIAEGFDFGKSFSQHDFFEIPYKKLYDSRIYKPVGFYTVISLRTNDNLKKLNELMEKSNGTLKEMTSAYNLTKAQVRMLKKNLGIISKWDESTKKCLLEHFEVISKAYNFSIISF